MILGPSRGRRLRPSNRSAVVVECVDGNVLMPLPTVVLRKSALRSTRSTCVRDYPQRLYHRTPGWVRTGALFHVRIRAAAAQSPGLTDPVLAAALLSAAQRYHDVGRWWCELFLLMPDHLHAMLAFPREPGMAAVIRDWKRGTARFYDVRWQENFFDHRIRSSHEKEATWIYIHGNPAAKDLCREDELWPYWWSALTSTR